MAFKYDFDRIIDRRGMDAAALDCIGIKHWGAEPDKAKPGFSEIPMWVADMNFETCPGITRALEKRIQHPLYGYFIPREEYYDSIINWQRDRHGNTNLEKKHIGYENGVHGCIITCIETLTEPGDAVFLHSPSYLGFLSDLKCTGRKTVLSPLMKDDKGVWRMDFEDMDRKIKENDVRLVIFCSPHNPTGRVWERWELERALDIFRENDCLVISDEIWSDIVFEGHGHIPTAMVNEDAKMRTINLYAPSKTFNLAGLIGSYHIIYDPVLNKRITKRGDVTHYNEMNVLSMHALMGAYSAEGHEWLDELLKYLEANLSYAVQRINNEFHGCSVTMPEGTYMLFMDCSRFLKDRNMTLDEFIKKGWDVGVKFQDGRAFAWEDAVRINAALPRSLLIEALDRLSEYLINDDK